MSSVPPSQHFLEVGVYGYHMRCVLGGFLAIYVAYGILVPLWEPVPPALGAQRLIHWTDREVAKMYFY